VRIPRKTLLGILAAVIALPVSPFVVAGFIFGASLFTDASGEDGGVRKTPCQIYRDNLYRAGIPPGQVIDMVAACISNYEHRRTYLLTNPNEIQKFRNRTYIAPPRLVEKNQRGEFNE
jgi:hypothetical protein